MREKLGLKELENEIPLSVVKTMQEPLLVTRTCSVSGKLYLAAEIQKFDIKRPEPLSAMSGKSPEEMFDIVSEDREILGNGENIIVRHPENTDEKKTIYITAHYDTTDTTTGVIDNGTGVAVVLETAKVVRQIQRRLEDTQSRTEESSLWTRLGLYPMSTIIHFSRSFRKTGLPWF